MESVAVERSDDQGQPGGRTDERGADRMQVSRFESRLSAPAMDLRRIRHFVVLAETLNFRRAAERLHIAQPALTVSIQKLETELGTALFTRDPRGVALTSCGEAALAEARRVMFYTGQLRDTIKAAACGAAGTLRVGFVGSATYETLPRLVRRFRAEYPAVELILKEATSDRITRMLEEERLDVGLVRTPLLRASSTAIDILEMDHYVAALPQAHPLTRREILRLADLADEDFVMYAAEEASGLHSTAMAACQLAGFLPRVSQEATQIQTVLALVESELGVALVPSATQRHASAGVVYRTLADYPKAASIGLALAYLPERESPVTQRFRSVATEEFMRSGGIGATE